MARERAGKYGYHEFKIEAEFSTRLLASSFLDKCGPAEQSWKPFTQS